MVTSPVKYHYFHRFFTYSVGRSVCAGVSTWLSRSSIAKGIRVVVRPSQPILNILPRDPNRRHCQAGSLTEAVDQSKNNAGVLRQAQRGQKPRVDQKRANAGLISMFSTARDCESTAYRSFWLEEFSARSVRRVTTGITGLWRASLHSDVAF